MEYNKAELEEHYKVQMGRLIEIAKEAVQRTAHETAPYIMDSRTLEVLHVDEGPEINEYAVGCRKVDIYDNLLELTKDVDEEEMRMTVIDNYFRGYRELVIRSFENAKEDPIYVEKLKAMSLQEFKEKFLHTFSKMVLWQECLLVILSMELKKEEVYMPVYVFDVSEENVQ